MAKLSRRDGREAPMGTEKRNTCVVRRKRVLGLVVSQLTAKGST